MLYVKFDGDIPVEATYTSPPIRAKTKIWQGRWNWKSFQEVSRIARLLTINTRVTYIPVDEGSHTSPRYDVIEPPKVGDKVSRTINGDYYPDGEIVKVSPTFQVTTSTGSRYFRSKNTSRWVRTGGSWVMVKGHISELNPSF